MIDDEMFKILFHPWVMMWTGQLLHMAKKLKELETAGRIISPVQFFREHPYAVVFSLLAGFIVYGLMHTSNQLTPIGAFTAGYMAESVLSVFTNREIKRIDEQGGNANTGGKENEDAKVD